MTSEGGHGPQTSGEYIQHHLQNLQVCKVDDAWVWNQCTGNPMTINVDSMFWSVLLGLVFIWIFRSAAKKSSSGTPGKFQAFFERLNCRFIIFVMIPIDFSQINVNHRIIRFFLSAGLKFCTYSKGLVPIRLKRLVRLFSI